ncbi:MAG TPA: NAD(P)-dependent oxidoreductase [Vicinamibacterales bacterium]|nr:NAD(P)-dependent oxidoreductase [Vicinamibacterales bacterium]
MSHPPITLLGLGIMGTGMAGRLLDAGYPLTVYNRTRLRADALAAKGARVADTPREAVAGAAVVIGMVADDQASRAIWTGPDGALASVGRGSVLIESSTLTIGWVRELAAMAADRGCEFLDAPVAGTRPHAASGQLLFMVGGEAATLDRVRDVFTPMARAVVHVGPVGSGARLKLINNFMAAVQAASFAEALALIEKSGLNREAALGVLTNGAPGSPMVRTMAERMTERAYEPPNFALRLMVKDIRYAIGEAGEYGVPFDTARAALGIFERALAAGHGDIDFAAIVEPLRRS